MLFGVSAQAGQWNYPDPTQEGTVMEGISAR